MILKVGFQSIRNVGVILAVVPCFTALMMHIFFRGEEKLQWNFSPLFFSLLWVYSFNN